MEENNNKEAFEPANKQVLYTSANTFVYVMGFVLVGCRSSSKEDMERQQHISISELESEGKNVIKVCCSYTARIIKGALEIGMTENDRLIFEQEVYNDHALINLTGFNENRFDNSEGYSLEAIDFDKMLNKIFKRAEYLSSRELKDHFLQAVFQDVTEGQNWDTHWNLARMEFENLFKERLKLMEHESFPNPTESKQQPTTGNKIEEDLKLLAFEALFTAPEHMDYTIELAKTLGIINDKGDFIKGGKGKYSIAALWYFLSQTNSPKMVSHYPGQEAIRTIAEYFKTSIGKNFWAENTDGVHPHPMGKAHNFYQKILDEHKRKQT